MPDLTRRAARLYRRLLGARPPGGEPDPGRPAAAGGAAAVAEVEAALGAVGADDRRRPAGGDARSALAAAAGMALAGLRAGATAPGPALAAARDLVAQAAGWGTPLVVHLHGGGHEAWHALADTGALQLFAANVQEAVDFTLVARRVAEEALLPAVVAMDGETAFGVEELLVPSPALLDRFVGDPGDVVHPPTPGQEMLFGRHRRRVPRRHDPERPLRTGGGPGPAATATAAARRAFVDPHLPALLDAALTAFGEATGRRHATLTAHRVQGAGLVLIAQGAAVETAEAVADQLRVDGLKVGVVGLRALRPFPTGKLVELLAGCRCAAVLERLDAPAGSETPLLAEVRGALDRARENDRAGREVHPGAGTLAERRVPRLASARYGLGGTPLAAADLAGWAVELVAALGRDGSKAKGGGEGWPSPVYLGLEVSPAAAAYPKRQAVLDALRRSYPEAARLGFRAVGPAPAGLTARALHLAVLRRAGEGGEEVVGEAARLLHRVAAGHLRARRAAAASDAPDNGWGEPRVDRLVYGHEPVRDPGDGLPAEIVAWHPATPPAPAEAPGLVAGVRAGGVVVFAPASSGAEALWEALPAALRRAASEGRLRLFAAPGGTGEGSAAPGLQDEAVLGALAGTLIAEGRVAASPRKLRQARRDELAARGLADEEIESRLAAFQAGYDRVRPLDPRHLPAVPERLGTGGPVAAEAADEVTVPSAVRRRLRSDDALDSLPGFWDRLGVLLHRPAAGAGFAGTNVAPDPYLAVAAVPPLTAALRDRSPARTAGGILPAFDPARCTACGACWTACPDAAVMPIAIGAAALLDFGMARAREHGRPADALRMAAGKLATAAGEALAAGGGRSGGPTTAGPLFDAAFARVLATLPLPAERKAAVQTAFDAVREEIAPLPVAAAAPFAPDLFAVAVNPDSCKGCGLCVAECEPEALTAAADSPLRSREARALWRLADELPAPAEAILERARRAAEAGDAPITPLAVALLSPEARGTMVGGHGAEAGSGEAIALRQVLGAAAHHLRPRRARLDGDLSDLQAKLAAAIHDALAGALPGADLEALSHGLDNLDRPDTDLAGLASRIETSFDSGRVDVVRLRRLVGAARELADLRWHLEQGEGGLGRAPFSLVLGGSPAGWAGVFPDNPFPLPVTVDTTGDAPALARGLLAGQLAAAVEGVAALRRARLEIERPADAEREGERLAHLAWSDLTAEERALCPPLLLATSEDSLVGGALAGLLELLAGELPVTVVVLAESGDPVDEGATVDGAGRAGSPFLARLLALPGLLPGQGAIHTTVAHPAHLDAGVAAVLAADGPGLVRVLAPSPRRHGTSPDRTLALAREAVAAGAFPLSEPGGPTDGAEAAEETVARSELAELTESHQQDVAALRADYEARLAALAAEIRIDTARRVRARLLALATRPPNSKTPPAGPNPKPAAAAEPPADPPAEEARP